jgi:hypothetical protein
MMPIQGNASTRKFMSSADLANFPILAQSRKFPAMIRAIFCWVSSKRSAIYKIVHMYKAADLQRRIWTGTAEILRCIVLLRH